METQHVKKSPPPKSSKNPIMQKHLDAVEQIESKAKLLNRQAEEPNIDDKHHIFIVDPRDGKVIRQGGVRDPNGTAQHSDLESHVYEAVTSLKPDIWRLSVLEDNRLAFLKEKLATPEQAAALRKEYQGYMDKYAKFGGLPNGRIQECLTEILERK